MFFFSFVMLKIGGTKNAIRNGKVFIQQFASERLSRKKFLHNLIGENLPEVEIGGKLESS